jgi:putative hydrolase of the HAD superfamily
MNNIEWIGQLDTVLFDLDNTIYDEKIYLQAAYWAIAQHIHLEYDHEPILVYQFLIRTLEQEGRTGLLDKLCENIGLPNSEIQLLLNLLRTVDIQPLIEPFEYFIPLIRNLLNAQIQVAVITNGNTIQQTNKIKSINWQGLDATLIFILANASAPKPNTASFSALKKQINLKEAIYIGDSASDVEFAQNCKIKFLHVNHFL